MREINHREPIDGPHGKDITIVYTCLEGDEGKPFYNLFARLYSDASCIDEYLITSTKIHTIQWSTDVNTPHKKLKGWNALKKSIPICSKIRFRFSMKAGVKSFYVKFTASKTPDPLSGTIVTIGYVAVL